MFEWQGKPSSSAVKRVITGPPQMMLQMALHVGVTAIAVMTTPLATMTLMIVLMEMEMWTTILSWHYGVKFYMAGQILNEP